MRAVCRGAGASSGSASTTTSSSCGGDSIVSIQLVSRARRAGLSITPRAVFQHQTVEALAAAAGVVAEPAASALSEADAGAACGRRACRRRRSCAGCKERGGPLDGFSQSMLLRVPAGLAEEHLTAALEAVLDHHDALRLPACDRDGCRTRRAEWQLEVAPPGCGCGRRPACGGSMSAVSTMRRLRELIAAEAEAAERRLDPGGRHDGAGGVVRCRAGAGRAAVACDPSSCGRWGVVADPGAGPCGGLAGDRGRAGGCAAAAGDVVPATGRSGLRRMRGSRALRRSFRSGAGCSASLRCCWRRTARSGSRHAWHGRASDADAAGCGDGGAADAGAGGVPWRHRRRAADRACAGGGGLVPAACPGVPLSVALRKSWRRSHAVLLDLEGHGREEGLAARSLAARRCPATST